MNSDFILVIIAINILLFAIAISNNLFGLLLILIIFDIWAILVNFIYQYYMNTDIKFEEACLYY